MRVAVSGWLVSALLCLSAVVQAAPVVYTLKTFQDGANTLDGSITVDDDGDGKVFASEITAWQFAATGIPAFSFSSGGTNTFKCLGSNGCFSIASGALSFDFTSVNQDDPYFEALSVTPYAYVSFVNALKDGSVQWSATDGVASDRLPGNVIAQAPASGVPEPATVILLGTAIAACFGVSGIRSRQRQSAAV